MKEEKYSVKVDYEKYLEIIENDIRSDIDKLNERIAERDSLNEKIQESEDQYRICINKLIDHNTSKTIEDVENLSDIIAATITNHQLIQEKIDKVNEQIRNLERKTHNETNNAIFDKKQIIKK